MKPKIKLIISFLLIAFFSFNVKQVFAADTGFFSNKNSSASGGFVLRNCDNAGDMAMKTVVDASSDSSARKKAFIALIKRYYGGCGLNEYSSTGTSHGTAEFNVRRNKVGALYIMLTMSGTEITETVRNNFKKDGQYNTQKVIDYYAGTASGKTKTRGQELFNKWENLVNQASVKVEYIKNYDFVNNSGFRPVGNSQYDVVRFSTDKKNDKAIVVKQDGNIRYVFRAECANPIGEKLTPIYEEKKPADPKNWVLQPKSQVRVCTAVGFGYDCLGGVYQGSVEAVPGKTVQWVHDIYNKGPDSTDKKITATVFKNKNNGSYTQLGSSHSTTNVIPLGGTYASSDSPMTNTMKVPEESPNTEFCQKISVKPKSRNSSSEVSSQKACVKIAQGWDLSATTTATKSNIKLGETASWKHEVKNEGPHTVNKDVSLTVVRSFYGKGILLGISLTPFETKKISVTSPTIKNKAKGKSVNINSSIQVTDSEVLKVCEEIKMDPKGSHSSSVGSSTPKCTLVESGWEIEPSTTVNKTKAFVGDEVIWTHKVKNNGPNKTDQAITYKSSGSGSKTMASGKNKDYSESFTEKWTVPSGSVPEQKFCRTTKAKPKSSSSSGEKTSDEACVTLPYNYQLAPKVKSITDIPTPGGSIAVSPQVSNTTPNSKPATKSEKIDWKLKVFINDIEQTTPTGGSGQKVFAVGADQTVANVNYSLPNNIKFGDKICFSLYLSKTLNNGITGAQGVPSTSDPVCISVGKRPKIQVLGGDIWAGRNIEANIDKVGSNFVGSWAEYGAVASDNILGLASGGALGNQANVCGYSLLSFTNYGCDTSTLGNYNFDPSSLDISKFFNQTDFNESNIVLSGGDEKILKFSNDVNVSGDMSDPVSGTKVIYAPDKTVTISSNIEYASGSYLSVDNLPQVVIIAKNIKIKDVVTRVDAWLVAANEVNTCDTVDNSSDLTKDDCLKQLTINGPIKAKKTKFHRIFGSDTISTQGDPAEIIRFRPDAYLWAFNHMNKEFSIKSTYVIDQPVRF